MLRWERINNRTEAKKIKQNGREEEKKEGEEDRRRRKEEKMQGERKKERMKKVLHKNLHFHGFSKRKHLLEHQGLGHGA